MSHNEYCHDNAVTESIFPLLKREHLKQKINSTTDHTETDAFDYIEMFYNSARELWRQPRPVSGKV